MTHSGPHPTKWTRQQEQRLVQLRKEGKTYKEIAALMGLTLNTVEGKCRRLRITKARAEVQFKPKRKRAIAPPPAINRGPITLPPLPSLQDD